MSCSLPVVYVLAGSLLSAATPAPEITPSRDPDRYPFRCAGMTVGLSHLRDAIEFHGQGLAAPGTHEEDLCWTDSTYSVTLYIDLEPEDVIQEITLYRGLVYPPGISYQAPPPYMVSPLLRSAEGTEAGIRLGSSAEQIFSAFGSPAVDTSAAGFRTIIYGLPPAPYISYGDFATIERLAVRNVPRYSDWSYKAIFTLRDDRLIRLTLHEGEGGVFRQ